MPALKKAIKDIIDKGGKCSAKEYTEIEKHMKAAKSVLVFGLGHDSPYWATLVEDITFVENVPEWADKFPELNVVKVAYNSKNLAKDVIHKPALLDLNLPESIKSKQFDLVFVDSPYGRTQGRMKSIHWGFQLGKVVLVHDYDRATEKLYVDHYAKDVKVVDRLAVCK